MKKIVLFTFLILAGSMGCVMAQMDGKQFMSGSLALAFSNQNPDIAKASNNYGFNFNVGLGKFKTNTRVSGWSLNTSLSGGKTYILNGSDEKTVDGINGFGVGVGRFWQFYKHFNEKVGIFAGPAVDLGYNFGKIITATSQNSTVEQKSNSISLSLGINAGAYYRLNERWWLEASLGFSQPAVLKYSQKDTKDVVGPGEMTQHNFTYGFSPGITFPSVGLGLRYFFKD